MSAVVAQTEEFVFLMDAPDILDDQLRKQFVAYQEAILNVARQYDGIDRGGAVWSWMTWWTGVDAEGRRVYDPFLFRLGRIPDPMRACYTHRYDLNLTDGIVESFVIYNDVKGNTQGVGSWLFSEFKDTSTVSVNRTSVCHCLPRDKTLSKLLPDRIMNRSASVPAKL